MEALLKEISLQKAWIGDKTISTIYFGGGTPSLLSGNELSHILSELKRAFSIEMDAEVTLEANPDDFTLQKTDEWVANGINRLSIGVQSFFDEDLVWMNRAHSAKQAGKSILMSQAAGITNITIDLIYGTPGLTEERWKKNVDTAIEYGIPHLSCYALTVESGTVLHHQIQKKLMSDISTESQAAQFLLLMKWMKEAGYEHYEISNFAKPGFRSRHNSSYWAGTSYLGLGPSAHSFNGQTRKWNVANNALYIESIKRGQIPSQEETLTPVQQVNEYIMTSLRRKEGLNLNYISSQFNGLSTEIISSSKKFINRGQMIEDGGNLILTDEGKLFADGIAAEMFLV